MLKVKLQNCSNTMFSKEIDLSSDCHCSWVNHLTSVRFSVSKIVIFTKDENKYLAKIAS